MSVGIYYPHINRKLEIIHSAVTYEAQDYMRSFKVTMRENAIDTMDVVLTDKGRDWYANKATVEDEVKLYVEYDEVSSTLGASQLRFDGYVYEAKPFVTDEGYFLYLKAKSVGRSVLDMVCGEQYGSESSNDSLDTLQEIITDATNGIVPLWVNKILGNAANASGHSLGTSSGGTDYVAPIAGTVRFQYYPYKQVNMCLNDLMDYMQAVKGAAAGPHWIIHPTNYLCVATVGNHEADPATLWPTWWNTNQAGSTIVVNRDMIVNEFTKRPKDANYVLYAGAFKRPGDADIWTENNHGDWLGGLCTLTSDNAAGNFKFGSFSLKAEMDAAEVVANFSYPAAQNAAWDVTKWGGRYNIPAFHFYAMKDVNVSGATVHLVTNAGHTYNYDFNADLAAVDTWYHITLPIGPYYKTAEVKEAQLWTVTGAPDWTDIDFIWFVFQDAGANQGVLWVDSVHFTGWVVRGAKKNADSPYRIKVITDELGKDDVGKSGAAGTTDIGTMARMAYAELLRASSSPVIGTVSIPGQPAIMAGQLAHIHAAETFAGTFRVDADMRIIEHQLTLSDAGLMSVLTLTDDVTNGRPMGPMNAYNLLQKATAPEFQTRQISSIKTFNIDITQAILEEGY